MIEGVPNPPLRFEQDPDSPEGTGTFHFQDGSSLFAHEPDLAKEVGAKPPTPGPDLRTADASPEENARMQRVLDAQQARADAGDPYGAAYGSADPRYGTAPRSVSDAGAPGANMTSAATGQPVSASAAPPAAPPPAGQPAPQATPQQAPPARPYVAGRAGGVVPVRQELTQETQGAPYSVEDAGARLEAERRVEQAKLAEFDAQRSTAEEQAARARAAIPGLQYQEAQGRSALSRLDNDYKVERARVGSMIDDIDKRAKVDPDAYYHKAGTAGVIGMVIGQALGAFSASVGHHENYAQKLLEDEQNREMRAQEDEIRRGEVTERNMLAKLHDQFGDLDQARAAYKLISNNLIDAQIQDFAAHAKSTDATNAANVWLAQRQADTLKAEQQFRDASYGKTTTRTDAKVVQAVGGHRMTDDELIAYQTKHNKALAGLKESENEIGYQGEGGGQGDKLAQRRALEARAAAAAGGPGVSPRLQGQIVAARNARDVVAEMAGTLGMKRDKAGEFSDPGLLDTLAAKVPYSDTRQKVTALKGSLIGEIGKAQSGGVLTEGMAEELRDQANHLGTPGEVGTFVRHFDNLMQSVERNVRDTAKLGGRGGGYEPDSGGQP